MPRRLMCVLSLAVALSGSGIAAHSAEATATARQVPMRAEHVVRSVSGTTTVALTRPATTVAAYWKGNPSARVTLAFSRDGVHFGAPRAAGRDEMGLERRDGTTYGALQTVRGAVAVRVTTSQPIAHLTVLGLTDGAAASAPAARRASTTSATTATTTATAEPPVVSRAGWGADPALMTWAPQFYPTKKLIVHHTDTSDSYTDTAGAEAQIRSIYYYHSVTQGWGDIGYNFLIDKFGTIYEGRYSRDYAGADPSGDNALGQGVTGAHTSGWNSGTVGVALLGTLTTHDATRAARDALERLLAWEASRNGIDPQATQTFVNPVSGATITTPNIAGHRDYNATACPGDAFYPTLPAIRSDVAALIAGTTPPPDTTPPTAPTGLKATPARTSVALAWTAATDDTGVSGYQVWRSKSATTGFTQVGSPTGTTYTIGSLARRTTYYFQVRAVDASGNVGPFSATVSARTG
ncbi:N-acetylmuramoyl-L-alanine amidase [Nocardioides cynanchi]|uniref:N-acetylmuramoyl-L-alanine amidase n=1 Tax=Nocardioides cynanchi TaxID=2558918 RepID=UPI0017857F3D|nr:N-acetylmuramoyl-L-alanine amidase [Nocardioides cynanchi]